MRSEQLRPDAFGRAMIYRYNRKLSKYQVQVAGQ